VLVEKFSELFSVSAASTRMIDARGSFSLLHILTQKLNNYREEGNQRLIARNTYQSVLLYVASSHFIYLMKMFRAIVKPKMFENRLFIIYHIILQETCIPFTSKLFESDWIIY